MPLNDSTEINYIVFIKTCWKWTLKTAYGASNLQTLKMAELNVKSLVERNFPVVTKF